MDSKKLLQVLALLSDGTDTPTNTNEQSCGKNIVVLQRGWVVVGDVYKSGSEFTMKNASIIRVWGTTKGLGEIAEFGKTDKTVLDKCNDITFHELSVVVLIDCNDKIWSKEL